MPRTTWPVLARSRKRYTWRVFAGDISGGLIAALIALPYGLALASMMGLPPTLGIVTSVVTAPVTALLGRNPVLIGGTASATVPFIALAVAQHGVGGAAQVCLVASVFMMCFCVLQLGQYILKVPHAVVTGFSCGIGAMMVLTQLSPMLGVQVAVDRTTTNLLYQAAVVLGHVAGARPGTVAISLAVIGVSLLAARVHTRLPGPLLGILAGMGIATVLGIKQGLVGAIDFRVPPFAGFSWQPADVWTVLPSGLGLAFVSSVNILLTSRVVDHFRGRHRPLMRTDADRELGAYGIANLGAAMFGAPMSVGIPARSLASVRCGATTRLSNLAHAAILLGMVALGRNAIARVPMAALAAVTAWVGIGLLEWSTWRRLARMRRVDAAAFLVTAMGVLTFNAVAAVALGCSLYGVHKLWLLRPRRQVRGDGFPSLDRGAVAYEREMEGLPQSAASNQARVVSESFGPPIDS
ncbi:MAG: SulP family inorganic anion transporter [Bryobacteraceae bacterium]